jgi:hypothetical protein
VRKSPIKKQGGKVMTRKDYELIAKAIASMQDAYTGDDWTINGAMYPFARQIADALEAENPKFDFDKFMKACGV